MMKKLTLGIIVILAGFCVNAEAFLPTVTTKCNLSACRDSGGFTVGGSALYWRATAPNQTFANTFDSIDLITFEGEGRRHHHNHHQEYDWGWNINVGYIYPCRGLDVYLSYTSWDNDRSSRLNHALFAPTAGILEALTAENAGPTLPLITDGTTFSPILPLFSITTDPAFVFNDVSTVVYSKRDISNHTWDLTLGQTVDVGCNFRVRWFGGLRYSQLENKLDTRFETTFTGDTPLTGIIVAGDELISLDDTVFAGATVLEDELSLTITDVFHHRSKFDGIGPRFGLDVNYNLGYCFGIVGSVSTSLLVGEVDNSFKEFVAATGSFTAVGPTGVSGITAQPPGAETPVATAIPLFTSEFSTSTDLTRLRYREHRIVPNIDAKIGLDWSYQFCNCSRSKITIEGGYSISHYFNANDRLIDFGLSEGDFGRQHNLDITFDGPYASVQIIF